jgi:hypothetical protein
MSGLRLLTVGEKPQIVAHAVSSVAGSKGFAVAANVTVEGIPDNGVVPGLFTQGAQTADVVVGIARRRGKAGGDIGPIAQWLGGLGVPVWRVLLVIIGQHTRPSDEKMIECLERPEQNIGGQRILLRLTTGRDVTLSFSGALSLVLSQAKSAPPPLNTPPHVPPLAQLSAQTVDLIVSDGDAELAAARDLSTIDWRNFQHVQSCRIGYITRTWWGAQSSDGAPLVNRLGGQVGWLDNPTVFARREDIPEHRVTFATANVGWDGIVPAGFRNVLASSVSQYPSMVVCFRLPDRMSAGSMNVMLAEQWMQDLELGARPCVRVYRLRSAMFTDIWHALTRVDPTPTHRFDALEPDLTLMNEE